MSTCQVSSLDQLYIYSIIALILLFNFLLTFNSIENCFPFHKQCKNPMLPQRGQNLFDLNNEPIHNANASKIIFEQ